MSPWVFAYFLFTHTHPVGRLQCIRIPISSGADDTQFMSGSTVLLPWSNAEFACILSHWRFIRSFVLMQKVLGILQLNSIQASQVR